MAQRNTLTMSEVREICNQHKYLTFRTFYDTTITVNGRIADIVWRKRVMDDNEPSQVVSFLPISLDQYISNKSPFIRH